MKQHKASRKTGSSKNASRAGAPRKTSARKAATPKLATSKQARSKLARVASRGGKSAKQASPKAAAAQQAPALPTGLVKLPGECLIGSLDDLRTQLVERMTNETPVSLDASSLERFDTAALQLLAAFTRDRKAAGRPVEWLSVPASLTEAAVLLNLTSVLGLDATAESLEVAA